MKNIVWNGAIVLMIAACSVPSTTSVVGQDDVTADQVADAALIAPGQLINVRCDHIEDAILVQYLECPNPSDDVSREIYVLAKCEDIQYWFLNLYPTCADKSSPSTRFNVPVNDDFEAAASSNFSTFDDGKSQSTISSVDGVKTATQTSGSVSVSVSSGMDIKQSSVWQGAVSQ